MIIRTQSPKNGSLKRKRDTPRTKQLTVAEQCEVLKAVVELVSTEVSPRDASAPAYDRWLAAAGSMHSDYHDSDPRRVDDHLADIYAKSTRRINRSRTVMLWHSP